MNDEPRSGRSLRLDTTRRPLHPPNMDIPGLPQIPTDNLYKFKAIGGLALFVVGVLSLGWVVWQGFTLQADDWASAKRVELLSQRVTDEAKIFDVFLRRGDTTGMNRKRKRMDSLTTEIERESEANQRAVTREEHLFRPVLLFIGTTLVVTLAGLIWSSIAFRDWYLKHQQYQDRLLVAETLRVETEVARLHAAGASATAPAEEGPINPS